MFYFVKNEKLHGPYDLPQIKVFFEKGLVNQDTKFFIKTDDRLKPVNMSNMVPAKKETIVISQTIKQEQVAEPPIPKQIEKQEVVVPPAPVTSPPVLPAPRKLVRATQTPKKKNNYVGKAASNTKDFFSSQWKGMLAGAGATFLLMILFINREGMFDSFPSFGSPFESRIERDLRNEMKKNGENLRRNWDESFEDHRKNQRELNKKMGKLFDEGSETQKQLRDRFDRSFP